MFETFRSSYRAAKKTKNRSVRLQLEELEGRCLLSSGFGPLGGITTGPDGDIWFLEKDRLGRIAPHSGLIQAFAQGINTGNYPNVAGSSMAEAPGGSIWFLSNHQVTRFTPSTNALDTFTLTSGQFPLGLAHRRTRWGGMGFGEAVGDLWNSADRSGRRKCAELCNR
jgi:hypothetical protein